MNLSRSNSQIGLDGFDTSMDDIRIEKYEALIPPQILQMQVPLSDVSKSVVSKGRSDAIKVINKTDDRLLVIVGPCSIHDPKAALEYAKLLVTAAKIYKNELVIIMRAYFEKPRTTVGWKGLINDPSLNDTYDINRGLGIARNLLASITELGLPVGCELLDTISPQFLGDMFSWGAIGARTTESQLHRELASGVSFPVGFKNGTNGNVNIAVDAIISASHRHTFLGVTKLGLAAINSTKGNPNCNIILRGGSDGPNYSPEKIANYRAQISKSNIIDSLMVDFSHGNSEKNHLNQQKVCDSISEQISNGDFSITGVMIESNINEGRQNLPNIDHSTEERPSNVIDSLKYGVSVTDACVSWSQTLPMLDQLANAIKQRRLHN
ncbi:Phospho-2-dehydro-3-deoxyheptonate aldolase, tyrosine-inhibited [Smittium culicis]|uniref:Phospho-2-dehydro-3-deoxyheptonate aldolase n=1 Tax=Smittium culicis TaxID=133412 RepID=A0A1R1XMI7_9FUNG|nr:Phospho-2-dehydro-3-deoxyheptonate aldolase, tyrosine-inhibited [Smittium culicis]